MEKTSRPHIDGIDYLRAIFSLFVVMLHRHIVGMSDLFDEKKYYLSQELVFSDFVNFFLFLTAVPSFILISCFLFADRNPDKNYLLKTIKRVGILYIFWVVFYLLYQGGLLNLLSNKPTSFGHFWILFFSGAHTFYYFFAILLVMILVAYVFLKLSTKIVAAFLIIFCALLFVLPFISIETQDYFLSAYWNPLNFLPYPLAAIIISRNKDKLQENPKIKYTVIITLLILAILQSTFEWNNFKNIVFYPTDGIAYPVYQRLSLVFISLVFLFVFLNPKIKSPKVVKFMSKYALSLFCLHAFLSPFAGYLRQGAMSPFLHQFIMLLIVVVGSYLSAYILSKIVRNDLLF